MKPPQHLMNKFKKNLLLAPYDGILSVMMACCSVLTFDLL